jgi:acetyl-CoA acetyltransferase
LGDTQAPAGFPTGHTTLYDTTLGWRFVNPRMEALGHTDSLGQTAENLAQERYQVTPDENAPDRVAQEYRVSREAQDRFALGSHQKAIAAIDDKRFREEVSPVPVRTRKTDAVVEVDDLGLVELNEAFAAQVLAVLHEWKMAPTDERLNPQRRGHRPRPSPGVLRRPHPDHPGPRDAAQTRGGAGAGNHVHRRRPGHRHGRREGGLTSSTRPAAAGRRQHRSAGPQHADAGGDGGRAVEEFRRWHGPAERAVLDPGSARL